MAEKPLTPSTLSSGSPDGTEPIRLRGHHAFCITHFKGLGYDDRFTAAAETLLRRLGRHPSPQVRLIAHPDPLCHSCPHLGSGGCAAKGPESEARLQTADLQTLALLGIDEGAPVPWREIARRVIDSEARGKRPFICETCQWVSICGEGLEGPGSTAES